MHKKRRGGNGNSYFKRIYYLISYRGFVRELINVPLKKINPQNKFLAFRFECNQFSIEYSQLFNKKKIIRMGGTTTVIGSFSIRPNVNYEREILHVTLSIKDAAGYQPDHGYATQRASFNN